MSMVFRSESNRDGVAKDKAWMCVLAIAGCVVMLGCQAESYPESWVLFEVKGGHQLSLMAYGKEFARTGQRFGLAKVLPDAEIIAERHEEDGTTSFLIDGTEPIVFREDARGVDVSLIDSLYKSRTRILTYTIAVRGPSLVDSIYRQPTPTESVVPLRASTTSPMRR